MAKDPIPQGMYKPAVRFGDVIFTAGMTPRRDGVLLAAGKISMADDPEDYRPAVVQAAKNALTAAENCLGEGERIARILSLTVFVNSAPDFTKQPKIADLASQYLFEQFGDAGIGARAAVGVASLPGDAPAEVQLIAAAGKVE